MNSQTNSGEIIESAQCSFTIHRSLFLNLLVLPELAQEISSFSLRAHRSDTREYQDCRERVCGVREDRRMVTDVE